jgi:hypothetical protein
VLAGVLKVRELAMPLKAKRFRDFAPRMQPMLPIYESNAKGSKSTGGLAARFYIMAPS